VDRFDEAVLRSVYAAGSGPVWLWTLVVVSLLGSGWMLFALVPVFVMPRLRAWRARAAWLLAAAVSASAIVSITKALTGRVRPWQALDLARTTGIALPVDPSFPSGHAAGSFAVAAFVLTLHRPAGIALFAMATLIALSRVALGVHYPTDVIAGAVLGTLLGLAFGALAKRGPSRRP
jgi:undecaprenyl-diphosphatase